MRIAGLLYRSARPQIGPLYGPRRLRPGRRRDHSDVRCVHGRRFIRRHASYEI